MLKNYFGVFTHWIFRQFRISLYLTECYDTFVDFKWEIPVDRINVIPADQLDYFPNPLGKR